MTIWVPGRVPPVTSKLGGAKAAVNKHLPTADFLRTLFAAQCVRRRMFEITTCEELRMPPNAGGTTTRAGPVRIEHDENGHRRLVTTESIASGDEILPLDGVVRTSPTRYSIQVGPEEHLDGMGPVDATNHQCDPSAFIDFSDPRRIVLRALRSLSVGDEVSIHYCATEYDMSSPFDCHCGADACLGRIQGYLYVSDDVACDVEPWLSPALRNLRISRAGPSGVTISPARTKPAFS
jgi:hypothetical protein